MSAFHFISGLPRSGSTLLAALLRQNPEFHASIMSPVGYMVTDLLHAMSPANEASSFLTEDIRLRSLRGLFTAYYGDAYEYVIFDNNRRWLAHLDLLDKLYPGSFVFTMVRPVTEIVESFERTLRKHPEQLSSIIGNIPNTNIYQRVKHYMEHMNVIGFAHNSLKDAYYGPKREKLFLIEYDELCQRPQRVMDAIQAALGLTPFPYNFTDIAQIPGARDFDADLGAPHLHELRSTISLPQHKPILPPDIANALPKPFWRPLRK